MAKAKSSKKAKKINKKAVKKTVKKIAKKAAVKKIVKKKAVIKTVKKKNVNLQAGPKSVKTSAPRPQKVQFTIDKKICTAETGKNLVDAARDNGIFIPVLCHFEGVKPAGSCRICTVKINGKAATACTSTVAEGMEVECITPELEDMRKMIVELLFVEGNHFCPSCEKSGNCDLQAMGYRYQMMVPRFPYDFPVRIPDAETPKLFIEKNRCIMCKRCIRVIRDKNGKAVFAMKKRGHKCEIVIDHKLASLLTDAQALEAMKICPVGAILKKEVGFNVPIGKRRYDVNPIGSDIQTHRN